MNVMNSSLNRLKEEVCEANHALVQAGLVLLTWGNASGRDESGQYLIIKPSGIPYENLTPDKMVVVDLNSGETVGGQYRPSCDTATHRRLYLAFPEIRGVVHTHSFSATAWAQAHRDLPILGTTAADWFYHDIPCTRPMTKSEIRGDYEWETGNVIIETFHLRQLRPMEVPAALVDSHGPFTWGKDVFHAVETAIVLEETAKTAIQTLTLSPNAVMDRALIEKHFLRKNGAEAYYGQKDQT